MNKGNLILDPSIQFKISIWFGLVWFGYVFMESTIIGYLMPNPFLYL